MYLASIADLRGQLGFDDMTDINVAIGDALDAAEVQVSAILRTDFDQVTMTDRFFMQETERMGRAVKTEILLSRGFLQAVPTQVLINYQAPIFETAFDIVQMAYGGTAGPLPNFTFDLEKGFGVDTTNYYHNTFIDVTYTSGFAADDSNPGSYLISSVPKWLQTATKLMALLMLADAAPVTEAGIMIDKKLIQQQAQLLLAKKVRYKPIALDPVSTAIAA